jgi:hypothetical protein
METLYFDRTLLSKCRFAFRVEYEGFIMIVSRGCAREMPSMEISYSVTLIVDELANTAKG